MSKDLGWAATGAGAGAAFGGPVGAGVGAGVGFLGSKLGLFGNDDAKKALMAKQKQLAAEAQRRREEVQRSHMQALTQQMSAFAPRNTVMAGMFGADAAFTGKQMADMTANPMGAPAPPEGEVANLVKAWEGMSDDEIKAMGAGSNPSAAGGKRSVERKNAVLAHREKVRAFEAQEAARRAQIEAAFGTPQGPAGITPSAPEAARRF